MFITCITNIDPGFNNFNTVFADETKIGNSLFSERQGKLKKKKKPRGAEFQLGVVYGGYG